MNGEAIATASMTSVNTYRANVDEVKSVTTDYFHVQELKAEAACEAHYKAYEDSVTSSTIDLHARMMHSALEPDSD